MFCQGMWPTRATFDFKFQCFLINIKFKEAQLRFTDHSKPALLHYQQVSGKEEEKEGELYGHHHFLLLTCHLCRIHQIK